MIYLFLKTDRAGNFYDRSKKLPVFFQETPCVM